MAVGNPERRKGGRGKNRAIGLANASGRQKKEKSLERSKVVVLMSGGGLGKAAVSCEKAWEKRVRAWNKGTSSRPLDVAAGLGGSGGK